jgi:hypothetical protein
VTTREAKLEEVVQALLAWGRDNVSPSDSPSLHLLLIAAATALNTPKDDYHPTAQNLAIDTILNDRS